MEKKNVLGAIVSILLLSFSAQEVFAEESGDPVGDYASAIQSSAAIPAGHFALLAHYADAFLGAKNGTGGHRTVYAQSLMDGTDDPEKNDEITDFYLLDIRRTADYNAGHIAGAVNVQLGNVADPGVLAMLPTDRPILVICYTGHTASIANAILGSLGFDAWTLRFGMTAWYSSTETAVWTSSSTSKQFITGGGYPVVTGSAP